MPQTHYKISEARKNFAEVLERANLGEEIVIMRGNEIYARIGPADPAGKRPFGLLAKRSFVVNRSAGASSGEVTSRQPCGLLVDDR